MIGWQSERFQRTKNMKSLSDYLRTPTEKRSDGARKLLALAKGKLRRKE